METKSKEIVKILDISSLKQSPYQGRLTGSKDDEKNALAEKQMDELARSIEEIGLMQPIIVRQSDKDAVFEIIDGHRRVMATRKLGRGQIKAIIRDCTDREAQIMAVVANLQRKNLNQIELAITYQKLLDTRVFKDKRELSNAIGKDETYIGDLLQALNMDERIIADLAEKNLIKDLRVLRLIRQAGKVDQDRKSEEQWALYKEAVWKKLGRKEIAKKLKEAKKPATISRMAMKVSKQNVNIRINTVKLKKDQKIKLEKLLAEKVTEILETLI